MKKILVLGAGGFIGHHLVNRLKAEGNFVIGADLKYPEFSITKADQFYITDLAIANNVEQVISNDIDEIYQLAADMGGAGYVFTKENDANILHNSAKINLNVLDTAVKKSVKKIFFSSSACVYPAHNQLDPSNPLCTESSVYPAAPDSDYGWEKLFSERAYLAYARNHNIAVRIARFHNVFGPEGTWCGGKEKAPAAICRKVALSNNSSIDVWGPGTQTRSFLYIDECIEGIIRLMASDLTEPVNLGSERSISINQLVYLVANIAKKTVHINNTPGPIGVMGRTSDNTMIQQHLNWQPAENLECGLEATYNWIVSQIAKGTND